MIDGAGPQLRAMILLGINAGYGNTNCARLEPKHMNLKNWLGRIPASKDWNSSACKALVPDRPGNHCMASGTQLKRFGACVRPQ